MSGFNWLEITITGEMKKPVYKYPEFVSRVTLQNTATKRYWLNLEIDPTKQEGIIIILKNPSRANLEISDKTVFNVSNYIYRNEGKYAVLKNIGNITIVNLIPNYQTYSDQLKFMKDDLIDRKNIEIISNLCQKHKNVIIAWGNHPKGLRDAYEKLKSLVMEMLNENQNDVYYVDKLSRSENPKHGQIWGYTDELIALP